MTDSTRRSLRTAYQTLVAWVTAVPVIAAILLGVLPKDADWGVKTAAVITSAVAGAAVVTKILNALEDRGVIPAWLKAPKDPAVIEGAVVADVPAEAEAIDAGELPPAVD